jgi:hypothetical protein
MAFGKDFNRRPDGRDVTIVRICQHYPAGDEPAESFL